MMKFTSLYVVGLLLLSCGSNKGEGGGMFCSSEFPEEPEKLTITWGSDGGMLNESENIYISLDSSYYEDSKYGNRQIIELDISENEVRDLYQIIINHDFDCIGEEEIETYDRGGTYMSVSADNYHTGKSNSGMTYIKESDEDDYYAVQSAIWELAGKKLEEKSFECVLELSDGLLKSNLDIQIYKGNEVIFSTIDGDSLVSEINLNLYPGKNYLEVNLLYKDSLNQYGSAAGHSWNQIYPEVYPDSNRIYLEFDGNKLVKDGMEESGYY